VAAATEALGLLVGAGDLPGALDVLADLRAAAAPAASAGLAALRPLPQQLATAGAVRSPPEAFMLSAASLVLYSDAGR